MFCGFYLVQTQNDMSSDLYLTETTSVPELSLIWTSDKALDVSLFFWSERLTAADINHNKYWTHPLSLLKILLLKYKTESNKRSQFEEYLVK